MPPRNHYYMNPPGSFLITSFLQGSRLNPDAPEFTPRSRAAIAAMATLSPHGNFETANHDPFSQTLTPIQLQQPRVMAPVISLPCPVIARTIQGSSEDSGDSERVSAATTAKSEAQGTDRETENRKVSYKIPRYARRNQSRSEPSDSSNTIG